MIKIGEYVRTTRGYIYKVQSKEHLNFLHWQDVMIGRIKKHSKNLIDLIEKGDFVNKELVYQFDDKEKTKYLQPNDVDGSVYYLEDFIKREGLSKILTHEQYEQNCYRLEG